MFSTAINIFNIYIIYWEKMTNFADEALLWFLCKRNGFASSYRNKTKQKILKLFMRKFTLFLASLFFTMGAMAQTQITANTATYTIKSVNRGYIYYDSHSGNLFSSSLPMSSYYHHLDL